MGYRYYNPNPSGKMVGDCVIRAISKATNRSWEEIYVKVAIQGLMMHDMPSSNSVWGSFLYNQNFHRYSIPDMCPDCYTVAEFAEDNPIGTYVLATGTHTDGMSYMQRPMNYRRGYSRDEAKDHMLDTLEDMMDEATTEKERNAIRRCMEKIKA